MKRILFLALAAFWLIVLAALAVIAIQLWHDPGGDQASVPVADAAQQISRGQYLARAGDCISCHTVRGGAHYAGGRRIPTPFGDLYAPNITPDRNTGIGEWTADDFWRAMHNGKSRDGSFLYPAFPYPNYTLVTRADADALFAYLRSVPAAHRPNQQHDLRFPYNQRLLLGLWRALYFRPGVYQPDPAQSVAWNRGAYLVQGLGHCNACHSNRNVLGATDAGAGLAGGLIPILNWYAPSLASDLESGIGEWPERDLARLLKTGVSPRGAVFGPMAEVVRQSLQHMSDSDIAAMAAYLKARPISGGQAPVTSRESGEDPVAMLRLGSALYEKHCEQCHKIGGGGSPPDYPPLAGNRSVTTPSAINPIRMVLNGGFPPSTAGNPRPFGMPPYGPLLNDREVAAVVTYIRNSWDNSAPQVSPNEVRVYRSVPLD
jgi:mono/diheme cytochrome c family protein